MEMISPRHKNKVLMNFDESTFSQAVSRWSSWLPKGKICKRKIKEMQKSVHLFLIAFSDGDLYYFFQQGISNSMTFAMFLLKLT